MEFGIVGLGRMGGNLARRALEQQHHVVGFNRDPGSTRDLERDGLDAAFSIGEFVDKLRAPRVVLIYVPHGEPTEQVCQSLQPLLQPGSVVADGGNSHWRDAPRRHALFARAGIHFLDVGTSGGLYGARRGACFMAGGDRAAYDIVEPILRALAVDDRATVFVGPSGSGHFVKLVHNAIEFGMVQAIAEGVELLHRADFELDLYRLFRTWQHGSVIRSWLVELMADALDQYDLRDLATFVEDTGEVKWVLQWAFDRDIPAPVTAIAQTALMRDRDVDSAAAKAVALLRNQFGGHPLHSAAPSDPRA